MKLMLVFCEICVKLKLYAIIISIENNKKER